jgi:hypothetical protein
MTNVHIANTDFEFELAESASMSIEEAWSRHPLCLQLQYLPLLYAASNDLIAVTAMPEDSFLQTLQNNLKAPNLPSCIPLQEMRSFCDQNCLSWGPSLRIQAWAQARQMNYSIPSDWSLIQEINSKAFSRGYSQFPESSLIEDSHALQRWLCSFSGPKVLKSCFGLSGMGHLILNEQTSMDKILAFCTKEWNAKRPIVGEPWLKRLFDFSTQWLLTLDGIAHLLGSTVFETNPNGVYLGTLAGPEETLFRSYLPFLHEHVVEVRKMLNDLAALGYFGHVGVDALLYWCDQKKEAALYPIVEINGRQTLSLVALRLQQMRFPDQMVRLSFTKRQPANDALLPTQVITPKGKKIAFKRSLHVEVLSV